MLPLVGVPAVQRLIMLAAAADNAQDLLLLTGVAVASADLSGELHCVRTARATTPWSSANHFAKKLSSISSEVNLAGGRMWTAHL